MRTTLYLLAPFVSIALLAGACRSDDGDDMVFATKGGESSGDLDDGDDNPGDGDGDDQGDDAGDDGAGDGPVFDVNSSPDIPPHEGCQKVDVLFAIDSTGSMGPHQENLIDSFDGFIEGMASHFGNTRDFHIGVITTDSYSFNAPECQVLGGLVTEVPGPNYQGKVVCNPYAEGYRFMTEEDDLEDKFSCTANVSPGGDFSEKPATASIAALQPAINAPGQCNDSFLRDDALLVLVLISNSMTGDDPSADAHPSQDPSGWYPEILALKGGNPENAVAIGFISAGDTWCIPNGWDGYQAPNLISFIEDFGERGVVANVCEPDYGPIFQDSLDTVIAACDDFVEPG
jgi:hypothetical protein